MATKGFWHAGTIVRYAHARLTLIGVEHDAHEPPVGRGMGRYDVEGVTDQVAEHDAQERRIDLGPDWSPLDAHVDLAARFAGEIERQLGELRHGIGQVEAHWVRHDALRE